MNFSRNLTALVLLVPLGACALASVGDGPAPQLFTLTASHPAPPSAGSAAKRAQIEVDEFAAPAALDTARIVQQASANELKYYADARWADRAPHLIQNLMVESLENSGRFASVASHGADLRGDYDLVGDIRQFAVDVSNPASPTVRIVLYARLVREDERTIIAAKSFETDVPVTGSGIAAIVTAYDTGLRQTLDGIAAWTAENAQGATTTAAN
jgi:cholesterol transport system auxiliary component